MHTESREFMILFSDGSRKTMHGSTVEIIILKCLTYLVGLHKEFTITAIIDEANAKIYGDFEWDFSYSEKDKEWLTGSSKVFALTDIETAVMSYARFLGADLEIAATWLTRQEF